MALSYTTAFSMDRCLSHLQNTMVCDSAMVRTAALPVLMTLAQCKSSRARQTPAVTLPKPLPSLHCCASAPPIQQHCMHMQVHTLSWWPSCFPFFCFQFVYCSGHTQSTAASCAASLPRSCLACTSSIIQTGTNYGHTHTRAHACHSIIPVHMRLERFCCCWCAAYLLPNVLGIMLQQAGCFQYGADQLIISDTHDIAQLVQVPQDGFWRQLQQVAAAAEAAAPISQRDGCAQRNILIQEGLQAFDRCEGWESAGQR